MPEIQEQHTRVKCGVCPVEGSRQATAEAKEGREASAGTAAASAAQRARGLTQETGLTCVAGPGVQGLCGAVYSGPQDSVWVSLQTVTRPKASVRRMIVSHMLELQQPVSESCAVGQSRVFIGVH